MKQNMQNLSLTLVKFTRVYSVISTVKLHRNKLSLLYYHKFEINNCRTFNRHPYQCTKYNYY